jgi:two-component system LytT family response regulator
MTDRPPIRTLIVDDDRDAVATSRRERPELVFLDVQMPELNGFQVLSALAPEELPAVIFVTAYDRYALRAFEVHALDYLLKPFDDERFHDALRRAKGHLSLTRASTLGQRLLSLLETIDGPTAAVPLPTSAAAAPPAAPAHAERLAIKDVGRVVFLPVEEIDWIEAADYYVQLHVGARTYLHRESMQSLETRLDPERFLRIHRSAIVNRRVVKELRHQGRREVVVVLAGGATLRVARSHRETLQRLFA